MAPGMFCGARSSSCSALQRWRKLPWLPRQQKQRPGAFGASRSFVWCPGKHLQHPGALQSILWLQKHQLQCPGPLLQRSVAPDTSCSVQEVCRSVQWLQKRPRALRSNSCNI